MISRALGPALGGSIGLMFTVANTISVATYTIGFSESLLDFLQVYIILSYSNKFLTQINTSQELHGFYYHIQDIVPSWDGIVVPLEECAVAGCRSNDVRIVGAPVLCIFLFIAFAGRIKY